MYTMICFVVHFNKFVVWNQCEAVSSKLISSSLAPACDVSITTLTLMLFTSSSVLQ